MTFAGPADRDAGARGECTLRPQPGDCVVCFAPAALALRVVTICAAIALSCIGRLEAATVATPHPAISGLVLSAAGKPVVGASVDLLPLETKLERSRRILRGESTRRCLAHTTTAADGRYLLQVAEVGAYRPGSEAGRCPSRVESIAGSLRGNHRPNFTSRPLKGDHAMPKFVTIGYGDRAG